MVSTNIIGSMRNFIVNNNTIKTAPIASRFTFIISAVMVGGKCDGVDLRHINFSIHHNALIGSDIDHLADNAASVFIVLILDEPALQADRKLVDESGSTVSALLAVRPLRANLSVTLLPDSTPK